MLHLPCTRFFQALNFKLKGASCSPSYLQEPCCARSILRITVTQTNMLQDFPAGRTLLNLVNRHVSGAIQHEFVAAAELLERQVRDGTTSTTQEPQQPLEAATVVTQAVVQPPSQEAAAEVTFEQLNCIIPR